MTTATHASDCQKATAAFRSAIRRWQDADAAYGRQAHQLATISTAGYAPDEEVERTAGAKLRTERAEAEADRLKAEMEGAEQTLPAAHRACTGEPAVTPAPKPTVVAVPASAPVRRVDIQGITHADHNAAIKREVDWGWRQAERADAAERKANRLREAIDLTAKERIDAVLEAVSQVPQQRTAKHDADCWQRHAGCLARRVEDLLYGKEVGR